MGICSSRRSEVRGGAGWSSVENVEVISKSGNDPQFNESTVNEKINKFEIYQ